MAEFDGEFEGRTPARQFQKIDILILAFNLAAEVAEAISDTCASATILLAAHANYNVDREQFRQDAAREIETITGEDNG